MLLKFTKMQGLGHDFMVVNGVTQKIFFSSELIKRLSNRHFGIGFDELLLVEPPYDPEMDFHLRTFSALGDEIKFCSHGSLCCARFVIDHHLINQTDLVISTESGALNLKVNDDDTVTLNVGIPDFSPKFFSKDRSVFESKVYSLPLKNSQNQDISAVFLHAPYAVVFLDKLDTSLIERLSLQIENHDFFSQKMHVVFVQVINQHLIKIQFDKKVASFEDFAYASAAAVTCGIYQGRLQNAVNVRALDDEWTVAWDGLGQKVSITSEPERIYEGTVCL